MTHRLKAFCAFLLALVALVATPQVARAGSTYYPNGYAGPFYMQASCYINLPVNGAKYAYGMLNSCQVRFSSTAGFYASRTGTGAMDTLSIATQYRFGHTFGQSIIDVVNQPSWTPRYPNDYTNLYCPQMTDSGGWNTGGGYTTRTVPGGIFNPDLAAGCTSIQYYRGVDAFDVHSNECCGNGSGC